MIANEWVPMDRRGPVLTEEALLRFEQTIGAQLPADYRAFLLNVNGGRTAGSHSVFSVGNQSSVLNSLFSLDAAEEAQDLAMRQLYTHDLPSGGLWVGYDDIGNLILMFSGEHRGELWHLDTGDARPDGSNPRVEWFDRRDVSKVADTFAEFMAGLRPLA